MLTWLSPHIFQWDTPNPVDEQVMVGHGLVRDGEILLIDPPVIPGLPDLIKGFGHVEAIILTTNHHTRGTRYLVDRFNCPVYAPRYPSEARLAMARIHDAIAYRDREILPGNLAAKRIQVFIGPKKRALIDEMALVSAQDHAAFIGDALVGHFGTPDLTVTQKTAMACFAALGEALPATVTLLLPGHGFPVAGDYKAQLAARFAFHASPAPL